MATSWARSWPYASRMSIAAARVSTVSMSAFSSRKARPSSPDWSQLDQRHLGEVGDHVPAGALGEEQRRVGGRDEALAVAAASRVVGDADADGEARRVRHVEHDAAHPLRDALGERRRLLRAGPREDHDELLPAVPRREVARTRDVAHDLGDRPQDLVAARVTEAVVDVLEEVEVHHQQREDEAVALRALDLRDQRLLEVAVVEQTGEAVGDGSHLELGRRSARSRAKPAVTLAKISSTCTASSDGTRPSSGSYEVEQAEQLAAGPAQRDEQGVVRVEPAHHALLELAGREVEQLLLGPRVARVVDEVHVAAAAELLAQHPATTRAGMGRSRITSL